MTDEKRYELIRENKYGVQFGRFDPPLVKCLVNGCKWIWRPDIDVSYISHSLRDFVKYWIYHKNIHLLTMHQLKKLRSERKIDLEDFIEELRRRRQTINDR